MTLTINSEKCKGCEFCIKACPKKIIKSSNKLNSKGFRYVVVGDGCTGCGLCIQMCPDNAIMLVK